MVNAAVAARDHGIDVAETVHDRPTEYLTLVRVTLATNGLTRSVSGTLFAGSRPAHRRDQGHYRAVRRDVGWSGHQYRHLSSRTGGPGRRRNLPGVGG